MGSPRDTSFAVIGAGKVGSSLATLLQRAGYEVTSFSSRTPESVAAASSRLGIAGTTDSSKAAVSAGALLICLGDDLIESVTNEIAAAVDLAGKFVIHSAGSMGTAPLRSAEQAGARVLAIHPLQAIADVESGVERLPGSWFAITCENHLGEWARAFVEDLGGIPLFVSEGERGKYHAAAVVASNFLVTLGAVAREIFGDLRPYLPLMKGTLANLAEMGVERSLTGPVVRGDTGTLLRNLSEISNLALEEFYRQNSAQTARFALLWGRLDAPSARRVFEALGVSDGDS